MKFVNRKFQSALFSTFCRNVDILTAEKFFLETDTFSQKDYDLAKTKAMLEAQKIENNILIRRNTKNNIPVSTLYYF